MLGRNAKITLPRSSRDDVRALCKAVGLELTPRAPDIDSAGVPATGTPWLELIVGDVAAAAGQLAESGLARLEYTDPAHPYFVGPGGLVFRLAAS